MCAGKSCVGPDLRPRQADPCSADPPQTTARYWATNHRTGLDEGDLRPHRVPYGRVILSGRIN